MEEGRRMIDAKTVGLSSIPFKRMTSLVKLSSSNFTAAIMRRSSVHTNYFQNVKYERFQRNRMVSGDGLHFNDVLFISMISH